MQEVYICDNDKCVQNLSQDINNHDLTNNDLNTNNNTYDLSNNHLKQEMKEEHKCNITCGFSRSGAKFKRNGSTQKIHQVTIGQNIPSHVVNNNMRGPIYRTVKVHSAYKGLVDLPCLDYGQGNLCLLTIVKGNPDIYVKTIDMIAAGLDVDKYIYSLNTLGQAPATWINVQICAQNGALIERLRLKQSEWRKRNNKPLRASKLQRFIQNNIDQEPVPLFQIKTQEERLQGLTLIEEEQLHQALIYNHAVDIHSNTVEYLQWLHKIRPDVNNLNNTNLLPSIHNVPKYDNAYFMGEYMVYGNGDTEFFPMGTIDITGHELGHALTKKLTKTDLKYEGISGAANEHFADVSSLGFEYEMYKLHNLDLDQTNNIKGSFDFFIGEDCGKNMSIIRDFEHPLSQYQPDRINGLYWVDPLDVKNDQGGVHTNSGPLNLGYVKTCKILGIEETTKKYLNALPGLPNTCSLAQYRDALKKQFPIFDIQSVVLDTIGLTSDLLHTVTTNPKKRARQE